MSFYVKSGGFTMPLATGAQSITGLGFQPKVVFLFGTVNTADGIAADATFSLGLTTIASDRRCIFFRSVDGIALNPGTSQVTTVQRNDCVYAQGSAGALTAQADVSSIDSDGFTLNWLSVSGAASVINYLALGGSTLSAKSVPVTVPGATGPQATTGVGFSPGCLISFGSAATTNPTYTALDTALTTLGVVLSATTPRPFSFFTKNPHNLTTPDPNYVRNSTYFVDTASGAGSAVASLQTIDSDGFTLNWSQVTLTTIFNFLALGGVSFDFRTITSPSSGTSQTVTGLGFAPQALIAFGADNLFQDDLGNSFMSFGVATPIDQRSVGWWNKSTSVVTQCKSNLNRTKGYEYIDIGNSVTDGFSLVSFNSDGYSLSWETPGYQSVVSVLAIGPPTVPGTPWIF